jgi:nitrate reductase assembly molybdenum cofactor insertion protein NarJ
MLRLIQEFCQMKRSFGAPDSFNVLERDVRKIHELLSEDGLGFQTAEHVSLSLEELQVEYIRLFGSDPLCSPDITHWTSGQAFMQSRRMADMAGFYRAFGLDIESGLKVDNLSVVFEFLSFLCLKILHALEKDKGEKVEITENALNSFRTEFVLPALGDFVKSIKDHSGTGFYEVVGELAEKVIEG